MALPRSAWPAAAPADEPFALAMRSSDVCVWQGRGQVVVAAAVALKRSSLCGCCLIYFGLWGIFLWEIEDGVKYLVTKESWSALPNKNYKWNGSRKIWHLLHAYKKVILPRFYII
jgi:hypothetical protein